MNNTDENNIIEVDNFVKETDIVKKKEVDSAINYLKKKNFIYEGEIDAPESEKGTDWVKRKQLLFKSTNFGDDKDRALQKTDKSCKCKRE